jgi:hypothetical protein
MSEQGAAEYGERVSCSMSVQIAHNPVATSGERERAIPPKLTPAMERDGGMSAQGRATFFKWVWKPSAFATPMEKLQNSRDAAGRQSNSAPKWPPCVVYRCPD